VCAGRALEVLLSLENLERVERKVETAEFECGGEVDETKDEEDEGKRRR
jgi:hypothetical protein